MTARKITNETRRVIIFFSIVGSILTAIIIAVAASAYVHSGLSQSVKTDSYGNVCGDPSLFQPQPGC